jgi:uncharacterized protein
LGNHLLKIKKIAVTIRTRRTELNTRRILLIPLFILCISAALATVSHAHRIPDPTGYVSDFSGVLTSDEIAILEALAADLLETNGTELAVVVVDYVTESGEDFGDAGVKYFNEQAIGQKDADNGVLVLLATLERELWIFPGKGLEAALPDYYCKEIVDRSGVPLLGRGSEQWGQALIAVVEDMSPYIKGEEFAEAESDDDCWGACGCFALFWAACIGLIGLVGWMARVRCPICKGKVKLVKSTTVIEPTKEHSGLEKREYECKVCWHKFVKSITLPAKGKKSSSGGKWGGWSSSSSGGWSSSSSSSSFGGFSGGSSGGGGGGSGF